MARPASQHPTDTELEILGVLWEHGPSTLGTICEALREHRAIATTTVSTMLKVMDEKGLVRRKAAAGSQRGSLWSAAITRRRAARGIVGKLLDRVFDGSTERLVAHIIEDRRLSPQDRAALRDLLDDNLAGE